MSTDWGLLEPAGARGFEASSDDAVLQAMLSVEAALLLAWGGGQEAADAVTDAVSGDSVVVDRAVLVDGVIRDGVPVVALVASLHASFDLRGLPTEHLHAGATSQDVVDSALVLVAQRSLADVRAGLVSISLRLRAEATTHAASLRLARTLGRDAAPSTLGVLFAGWLDAVGSVIERLDRLDYPVQYAGAVGTGEQADRHGGRSGAVDEIRAALAAGLGLDDPGRSWQTDRAPVLDIAAVAAGTSVALGRIGRELTALSSEQIGVLGLASSGASSAMPHKRNPVEAVAMTTAGLQVPGLLSTVAASSLGVDERPAGDWHASWSPLRSLLRGALGATVAADHVFHGLDVHPAAALRDLERANGFGRDDAATIAASSRIVEAAVARSIRIVGHPAPTGRGPRP